MSALPPNPVLRKLGLPNDARVVVLHADDIGMCQSSLTAWEAALDAGIMSSAATMVPCPWYPSVARICRERANDPHLDMGVHLTLTSEWNDYRWGPISSRSRDTGLLDEEGYFHRRADGVHSRASTEGVAEELRAQLMRALNDDIDVTHIDTHMLSLFHPRLMPAYVALALEFRLPLNLMRSPYAMYGAANTGPVDSAGSRSLVAAAEAHGIPVFDHLTVLPLNQPENRLETAQHILATAPAGLTNLLFHPSAATPELRALTPDWRSRVADMELFISDGWRDAVAASGVRVINFRTLRALVRGEAPRMRT
jgi:predicted glycoside hydrolase/deacetylase ChbG (UPF0249 family)